LSDFRVGIFLNDALDIFIGHRSCTEPPVARDDQTNWVQSDTGSASREKLLLWGQKRIEVTEVLFPSGVAEHLIEISGRQPITLHGASIVSQQGKGVNADDVKQRKELLSNPFLPVVARALLGLTISLQIHRDGAMSLGKRSNPMMPEIPGIRNTMEQDDRFAGARLDIVPSHRFAFAWSLHEAVGNFYILQDFDGSVAVWRTRGDMPEATDLVLDVLPVSGGEAFERAGLLSRELLSTLVHVNGPFRRDSKDDSLSLNQAHPCDSSQSAD
jgi:hypothetical protein